MTAFKEWLIKPIIKALLMGVITVLIGVFISAAGLVQGALSVFYVVLTIILFILYLILLIFYNTFEVNYVKRSKALERQNETFEFAMISLISIFQQSSRNANKLIHEIVDKGKVDLNSWNFDLASTLVCEKIYTMLCKLDEKCNAFDVGYIRLDESASNDNVIYMNAYANYSMTQPTVFLKKRDITDPNSYHDAQLFLKNSADIEILMDEAEIAEVFEYRTPRSRINSDKYSQYIGIPVICATGHKSKMVGLMEIACLNGNKLSTDRSVVREMTEKYFMPYAQLLLLLHKLEKALLAVPAGSKG